MTPDVKDFVYLKTIISFCCVILFGAVYYYCFLGKEDMIERRYRSKTTDHAQILYDLRKVSCLSKTSCSLDMDK
jgi:hypothetical protein